MPRLLGFRRSSSLAQRVGPPLGWNSAFGFTREPTGQEQCAGSVLQASTRQRQQRHPVAQQAVGARQADGGGSAPPGFSHPSAAHRVSHYTLQTGCKPAWRVQLLVERGADVHARTDSPSPGYPGATAIYFASGSPAVKAFLLSRGLKTA